jgi:hypothetical protein
VTLDLGSQNFVGSLVVFYYSDLFELSLTTHVGHELMQVHFLLVGYLFAWVLVGVDPGPNRLSYPLRLILLFATMAFHAFFFLALMNGTEVLQADFFGSLGRTWGRGLLADQRRPGLMQRERRLVPGGIDTRGAGSAKKIAHRLGVEILGGGSGELFLRAAEIFERGEHGIAIAAIGEDIGETLDGGGIGGQRKDAVAGEDVGMDGLDGAAVQREGGDVLQRPAQARGGELKG